MKSRKLVFFVCVVLIGCVSSHVTSFVDPMRSDFVATHILVHSLARDKELMTMQEQEFAYALVERHVWADTWNKYFPPLREYSSDEIVERLGKLRTQFGIDAVMDIATNGSSSTTIIDPGSRYRSASASERLSGLTMTATLFRCPQSEKIYLGQVDANAVSDPSILSGSTFVVSMAKAVADDLLAKQVVRKSDW